MSTRESLAPIRNAFSEASDEALNYLWDRGLPLRYAYGDAQEGQRRVIYLRTYANGDPDIYGPTYTLTGPTADDPRILEVHPDVHPDETDQAALGASLRRRRLPGVTEHQANSRAAALGKRMVKHNLSLIAPGDPHAARGSEYRLADSILRNIRFRNPDCAFETHNTPLPGDSCIFMRRDVASYPGRVATYLSHLWGVPIIEAPSTTLTGNNTRMILLEMEYDDERFRVDVMRGLFERLVHNKVNLPDKPATPDYSYRRDITKEECLAASIELGERKPFGELSAEQCANLRLPPGSRTIHWTGDMWPGSYAGVIVVPFSDASHPRLYDYRNIKLPGTGVFSSI